MITLMPWRPALGILGALGCVAAIAIIIFTPRFARDGTIEQKAESTSAPTHVRQYAFPTLLSIGVIDSATRMGFLTFLPFILSAKGASLPVIGIALTLVFAGGAAGKLVCAFIGARIGATATVCLTETLTAILILAILPLPLEAAIIILPLIGIALNGTSSVLYGSVPDLVEPSKRTRAFGIFYTGTIGAGAIAPVLYGFAGDALGLIGAVVLVALVVLVTIPLALILRPALSAQRQSPSTV
jgi:predicted MFS family arabinose efflux permease